MAGTGEGKIIFFACSHKAIYTIAGLLHRMATLEYSGVVDRQPPPPLHLVYGIRTVLPDTIRPVITSNGGLILQAQDAMSARAEAEHLPENS